MYCTVFNCDAVFRFVPCTSVSMSKKSFPLLFAVFLILTLDRIPHYRLDPKSINK